MTHRNNRSARVVVIGGKATVPYTHQTTAVLRSPDLNVKDCFEKFELQYKRQTILELGT